MIIEWAEAQDLLSADDGDETTVTKMLEAITSMFEREAHRHIETATITKIVNGDGTQSIYLPEQPRTITSIHVSSDQIWDAGTLIAATDYNFDNTLVRRLGSNNWWRGWQNIQVVFVAGFANVQEDAPDVWWAAQITLQKMWSHLQAEQSYDIDVVSSDTKNDTKLNFRNPQFLDAETRGILLEIAPWQE
jgi:hypothetical protein